MQFADVLIFVNSSGSRASFESKETPGWYLPLVLWSASTIYACWLHMRTQLNQRLRAVGHTNAHTMMNGAVTQDSSMMMEP